MKMTANDFELLRQNSQKGRSEKKKYNVNGKMMTLADIAKESGVTEQTIRLRLKSGMTPDDAIRFKASTGNRRILTNKKTSNNKKLCCLAEFSKMVGLSMPAIYSRARNSTFLLTADVQATVKTKKLYFLSDLEAWHKEWTERNENN